MHINVAPLRNISMFTAQSHVCGSFNEALSHSVSHTPTHTHAHPSRLVFTSLLGIVIYADMFENVKVTEVRF